MKQILITDCLLRRMLLAFHIYNVDIKNRNVHLFAQTFY